jgi:hypothetical protein
MDMTHGDAFNDMPEEYREYREENEASRYSEVATEEQSEADKAIADGKPRWMHHENSGWKYVVIKDRGWGQQGRLLRIEEALSNAHDYGICEAFVTDILPYGQTPPPAVPEKLLTDSMGRRWDWKPGKEEQKLIAKHADIIHRDKLPSYKPDPLPDGPATINGMWEAIIKADVCFKYMKDGGEYVEKESTLIRLEGCEVTVAPTDPPSDNLSVACDVMFVDQERIPSGAAGILYIDELNADGSRKAYAKQYGGKASFKERDVYVPMSGSTRVSYFFSLATQTKPSLNRCPDCDNTLEQRSMPDGIEEWCGECNVKVEIEAKTENWESHDWAARFPFTDPNSDPEWLVCLRCGVHSKPGNATIASCSFFTDMDKELWGDKELDLLVKAAEGVCDLEVPASERGLNVAICGLQVALEEYSKADKEPTETKGQMHPDMIRAELQKAMDEGDPVSVDIKPEFADDIPGTIGMVTSLGDGFVLVGNGATILFKWIYSVKRMGSGNDALMREIASCEELTIYSAQMNIKPFYSVDMLTIVKIIAQKLEKYRNDGE